MATFSVQPVRPLAADGHALAHALHAAGVTGQSQILVAGPSGPMAMLWLGNHGFRKATLVAANRVSSQRQANALLVPQALSPRELADMLGADGGCLAMGGVVIAEIPAGQIAGALESIPGVLAERGFRPERELHEGGRHIYIARRTGFGFKAAA